MVLLKKGQVLPRIDEFAIILLAGITIIIVFALVWGNPTTENAPQVNPVSKTLTLSPGSTSSFNLEIIGNLTNVTLAATGDVGDWISFNKNNFDVSGSTTVKVTVTVPFGASFITHSGAIQIEATGGNQTVPVSVTVSQGPVTLIASLKVSQPEFSVSSTDTSKTLDSKENLDISKSYFSEKYSSLVGTINDRDLPLLTDASLHLIIEDTNSLGNLIILINGHEIFNQIVGIGETIVPINTSQIKGASVITIKADTPGWRFWDTNFYKIRLAEFTITLKGTLSQVSTFSLTQDEIDSFGYFNLFFRIKDSSRPIPRLIIKIDNQSVYSKIPPLIYANETFSSDVYGNNLTIFLTPGNNTITFSMEENGYYDISEANLVLYTKS